jgi:hypothetical protein
MLLGSVSVSLAIIQLWSERLAVVKRIGQQCNVTVKAFFARGLGYCEIKRLAPLDDDTAEGQNLVATLLLKVTPGNGA